MKPPQVTVDLVVQMSQVTDALSRLQVELSDLIKFKRELQEQQGRLGRLVDDLISHQQLNVVAKNDLLDVIAALGILARRAK